MKKKIISLFLLLFLTFSLITGCGKDEKKDKNNNNNNDDDSVVTPGGDDTDSTPKTLYKNYAWNYFDTITTIYGYEVSGDEFDKTFQSVIAIVGEYHKLFDIYNEYDGMVNLCTINKLYNGEHKQFTVDRKIIDMLLYAKKMYNLTDGKMNIAMGSVLSIWHDYRTAGSENPSKAELPPMSLLEEAAQHTDINDLIIDEVNNTVYLSDPAMRLDVGAIAKGYAVEMVAQYIESLDKDGYVVDIGGNLRVTGRKANGDKWKTGIENPGIEGGSYIEYIGLDKEAIVTSGSYQRFYMVNGKSYHHIIDNETLMPAKGFLSVSIICKSSADGDGLSTALFCMSLEDGMALVNSLDGVEAMWVTEDETIHYSAGFDKHLYK